MSSAVSGSKVALNSENFLMYLECPVSLEPMASAVTLVPCMHKINESVALQIFGPMKEEECKDKQPCPICKKVVKAHFADHTFRNVVAAFFNSASAPEMALPAIPVKFEADKKLKLSEIPSFSVPARFIVIADQWNPGFAPPSGSKLCKKIELKSTTKQSLLSDIVFCGYQNGQLQLGVYFRDGYSWEKLKEYYSSARIPKSAIMPDRILTGAPDLIRTLFAVVAMHNEIPAAAYTCMKEVITAGRWK